MARTSTIPRLRGRTEEDERAAQERERVGRAANVFELDPAEARGGLISQSRATTEQEQREREFRRASSGIQTTPGQGLPGTLEPGPRGEIWLRQRFNKGGSITPVIVTKLSDHSPEDQMRLKQMYQDRSRIAQDLDLSPADRQLALDTKDAQISTVPKQPPILREPDAQEQINARNIKGPDGVTDYYLDHQGNPKPYENADKDLDKEKRSFVNTGVNALRKLSEDKGLDLSEEAMVQTMLTRWDLVDGKTDPDANFIPHLEPAWQGAMSDLENAGAKVTEQDMLDMMELYVGDAGKRDPAVSPVEARHDFLQHWKSEIGGSGRYSSVVPKMSAATEMLFRTAGSDTVTGPNDPWAGPDETSGTLPGGLALSGAGTAALPTPKGFESVWPQLDAEDRADVLGLTAQGISAKEILARMKKAGII